MYSSSDGKVAASGAPRPMLLNPGSAAPGSDLSRADTKTTAAMAAAANPVTQITLRMA